MILRSTRMKTALATRPLLVWGLILAAIGAVHTPAQAQPSGRIAYLHGSTAYVASPTGGPAQVLPRSKGSIAVSLSPTGRTALYFVASGPKDEFGQNPPAQGFVSRAPFSSAQPLPAPLNRVLIPEVIWTSDGATAYVNASKDNPFQRDFTQSYRPATGELRSEPSAVHSVSRDGRVAAWNTDSEIRIREAGKPAVTLFSVAKPQPLHDAFRRARNPAKLQGFQNYPKNRSRDASDWRLGPPALTPDGKRLFFPANMGDGVGASGNTAFCFFAVDIPTRQLAVLSGVGTIEGQMPDLCQVSSDARRLLFTHGSHGSARESWNYVTVVDLLNQKSVELLNRDPRHRGDVNLTDGPPCWSPDGLYVAADALYYAYDSSQDTIKPWSPTTGRAKAVSASKWKPSPDDYAVQIFDAATGKSVRQIPGIRSVSWSR